jgi:hypothetical protein
LACGISLGGTALRFAGRSARHYGQQRIMRRLQARSDRKQQMRAWSANLLCESSLFGTVAATACPIMPTPYPCRCHLCPLCPRPTLWWIQRSIDYLHALAMPCVCPAKTPGCDVFAAGLSLACPASESLAHASSMSRCLSFGRGPRALFVLALKHP